MKAEIYERYAKLFDAFVMFDRASLTLNGTEAGRALRMWSVTADVQCIVLELDRRDFETDRVIRWTCVSCEGIHVHEDER